MGKNTREIKYFLYEIAFLVVLNLFPVKNGFWAIFEMAKMEFGQKKLNFL